MLRFLGVEGKLDYVAMSLVAMVSSPYSLLSPLSSPLLSYSFHSAVAALRKRKIPTSLSYNPSEDAHSKAIVTAVEKELRNLKVGRRGL